ILCICTSPGKTVGRMAVTYLGQTDFRGTDWAVGIKTEDRFRHIYIIGKTGTGKSTLIESMALQDLERGRGFALLDPHGDLVERVAARAANSPLADAIYFNARDPAQPYGFIAREGESGRSRTP